MARWRHYKRTGNAAADTRDLQQNGRPRVSEDWDTAGSDFQSPGAGYTGFAADGYWYEDGERVTGALAESLGSDLQPLNSLKWDVDPEDWTHTQEAEALLLEIGAGAGGQTFSMTVRERRRWTLRGDFLIRLQVEDCAIAVGGDDFDGTDNAVWLGIARLTDAATALRVKRYRGKTTNGIAVEVEGGGQFIGAEAEALTDFALVMQRHAGEVTASVVETDGTEHVLWGPFPYPGMMLVDIGARNTGPGAWSTRLVAFEHEIGRHTYSNRASWATEAEGGAVLEDFWGDELDPQLWTATETNGGTVEVVPGVDDAPGTGVNLAAPAQNDVAEVASWHVTGDHTVSVDWSFPDTVTATNAAPEEDVILRLLVESDPARPALYLEMALDGSGKLNARACRLPGGGGAAVVLDVHQTDFDVDGVQRYRYRVERVGPVFTLQIVDPGQNVIVEATSDDDLPSLPVAYRMQTFAESSMGSVECDVAGFQLVTPHALALDAWPERFYAATTKADAAEVVPGTDPDTTQNEVAIIDVATRAVVWRAVGGGDGTAVDPGQQALPQGEVWDPFFDSATGRLWVPVRNPDLPTAGTWVAFDLRMDEVRGNVLGNQRRFADLTVGHARIAYRQLGIGYRNAGIDEYGGLGTPTAGLPLKYETFTRSNGDTWHVWATKDEGIALYRVNGGAADACLVLAPLGGGTPILSVVNRIAVIPGTAAQPPQLVASAAVRTDLCVVVYRDLDATMAAVEPQPGSTAYGADEADAVYTRESLSGDWTGATPQPTPKLFDQGSAGGDDIDAFVPPTQAAVGGDGFALIAFPQAFAVTLIQDRADPADADVTYWQRQSGGLIAEAPLVITGRPRAVRLTRDADLDAVPARGFLVVQEDGNNNGVAGEAPRLQVISLARQNVAYTLEPTDIDADEFAGIDPMGYAVRIIDAPPDTDAGSRLVFTYDDPPGAVVEWDLWSVAPTSFGGPHIGGTKIEMTGWGLEGVRAVRVGGVDCFRVRVEADPGDDPPTLYAVTRALAFIEYPDDHSPVMPDEDLVATPEWPHDLDLVFNDGRVITLADGFTYESNLCIERTLRRLMARIPLPEDRMEKDPKTNTWQRHLWVALAALICNFRENFQAKVERDMTRATAEGDGLLAWAHSAGAGRPYSAMSDAQLRAYILARSFGSRVTVKSIKDALETILGYRPDVTEGYREYTVTIDPAQMDAGPEGDASFWGEVGDAAPLQTAFFDRDFWYGEHAAVIAARTVLDFFRAAGVRARVVVEPAA